MPKVNAKAPTRKKPKARHRIADFFERYSIAALAGAIVIVFAVVVVMWAGGYVGLMSERVETAMRAGAVKSGFAVKTVSLMGRREADREDIKDAIGPIVGSSILHFDLDAARRRVENLGWVKAASVSRLLPDTIHVSIRERTPAAVWQMSGALHLIDESGAVIRKVGAQEHASLPLIVGAGAPDAAADILAALRARPEIAETTAALVRVSDRRWNMRLKNGLDVKLPESGFVDALDLLGDLVAREGALDRSLEYVDLRDPERLVARKRGAAAETADKPDARR
jgi:cell division protein FtsQ